VTTVVAADATGAVLHEVPLLPIAPGGGDGVAPTPAD
jgi:hypothetical protein